MAREAPDILETGQLKDKSSGSAYDVDTLAGSGGSGGTADAIVTSGETIQDAHDNDIPSGDAGGWIHISSGYDNGDTLPIQIQKPVLITGSGWGQDARLDFGGNTTDPVFELNNRGATETNPRQGVSMQDLRVDGGHSALLFVEQENFYCKNCLFNDQAVHGVDFSGSDFSGWAVFNKVAVEDFGTGPGWELRDGSPEPNNTVMKDCLAREGGDGSAGTGVGVALGGFGVEWRGGGIEQNDSTGLIVDDGSQGDYLIQGPYFESNALQESGGNADADIYIQNGSGFKWKTIKSTYHADGGTPANRSIILDARNTILEYPRGDDVTVDVGPNGQDVFLNYEIGETTTGVNGVQVTIDASATRIVRNGASVNGGDPTTTGQWNGADPFEGLVVRDTTNNITYLYIDGGFVSI